MSLIAIATLLLSVSALFTYLNQRVLKLPSSIGVMLIAVVMSAVILTFGRTFHATSDLLKDLAKSINFSTLVLNIMLAFLLFATAMHFDYRKLKLLRLPIILLGTGGVIIATFVYGYLFYAALHLINIDISLVYCFLFGAMVAPTDPIAVSAILKRTRMPSRLQTIISGESLFNDAVSLVLFVVLLDVSKMPAAHIKAEKILVMLGKEVLGGTSLGLVAGFIGYWLIRKLNDFQSILLISVSLVLIISLVAQKLHASVPLAAVIAGLIIGNQNYEKGSPAGRPLARIWSLFDEVLNTILFVMIGLQLVLLPFVLSYWLIGLLAVVIAIIARAASLILPLVFSLKKVKAGNLFILTWAGVRGGITIAMALILPAAPYRELVLSSCYIIVLFSILVQGLTLGPVISKLTDRKLSEE